MALHRVVRIFLVILAIASTGCTNSPASIRPTCKVWVTLTDELAQGVLGPGISLRMDEMVKAAQASASTDLMHLVDRLNYEMSLADIHSTSLPPGAVEAGQNLNAFCASHGGPSA